MRKTIVSGIEYSLYEYIAAEDLVGINIHRLIEYTLRVNNAKDDEKIMAEIMNYLPELSRLVKAAVISPKLERPKISLVIGLVSNKQFRDTFTETFSGISEVVSDLEKGAIPKKE